MFVRGFYWCLSRGFYSLVLNRFRILPVPRIVPRITCLSRESSLESPACPANQSESVPRIMRQRVNVPVPSQREPRACPESRGNEPRNESRACPESRARVTRRVTRQRVTPRRPEPRGNDPRACPESTRSTCLSRTTCPEPRVPNHVSRTTCPEPRVPNHAVPNHAVPNHAVPTSHVPVPSHVPSHALPSRVTPESRAESRPSPVPSHESPESRVNVRVDAVSRVNAARF